MSTVLFIIGFLITGIPIGRALALSDAEPQGAFVAMVLFLFVAFASSVASHLVVSRRARRIPGKSASLIAGAISAGVFCAILASVHHGVGLWPALLIASVAAVSVASAFVLCSPKAASR